MIDAGDVWGWESLQTQTFGCKHQTAWDFTQADGKWVRNNLRFWLENMDWIVGDSVIEFNPAPPKPQTVSSVGHYLNLCRPSRIEERTFALYRACS